MRDVTVYFSNTIIIPLVRIFMLLYDYIGMTDVI